MRKTIHVKLPLLLAVLVFEFGFPTGAQDRPPQDHLGNGATKLVLLGTGTPSPEPSRSGPSLAVIVNNRSYLVDFGPGLVRRTVEASERGVPGLGMAKLTRAFVTHLHSDHTAGFPDLIFTPAVTGRKAPLEVYGPPGVEKMTTNILAAYREDIQIRLHDLEPSVPEAYIVNAHDMPPGKIYQEDGITVTAFSVSHGAWKSAYGYRFDTPGLSIVVSGDTAYSDELIEHAKGCDILVHEVYSSSGLAKRPPEWRKYHATYHTSDTDVARIASAVKPKLLVLTHELLFGESEQQLLAAIRQGYDGKVVSGRDLDIFQ